MSCSKTRMPWSFFLNTLHWVNDLVVFNGWEFDKYCSERWFNNFLMGIFFNWVAKKTPSRQDMRICVLFVLLQLLFLKHVSSKLRWSSMMQNIIRSGTQKLHVRSNTMFPPFTKWSASLHLETFSTPNLYSFCLQKRKKRANKPLESNRVKKLQIIPGIDPT